MRVLPPVGAAAVAAVAATMLFAPAASAHNAPGDNGTIKIHDAKTGQELRGNEPHVCTFYLDAFGFDGLQQADWRIVEKPPTATAKEDVVTKGSITLDAKGDGRTADMTLLNGHYKLEWNFDTEHGKAKHKVFWVKCAATGGTTGSTTAGPTGGTTTGSTGGTTAGTTSGTTGDTTSGSTTGGTSTPTPSTTSATGGTSGNGSSGGGNLAETGASVIGISAAGAAMLAAGGVLLLRRRSGRQHH